MKNMEWKEKLIKAFADKHGLQDMNAYIETGTKIKYIASFIEETLSTALAQRDDALIKKIKGMMKEVNDNSNIGEDTEFAYNEALYDLLSHLQETEGRVKKER